MNDTEIQLYADRLMEMVDPLEDRSTTSGTSTLGNPTDWLFDAMGAVISPAGVVVSEASALQCSAVLACVRVIAESIGSIPLQVKRKLSPKGSEPAPNHPAYSLLFEQPNDDMSALVMRETMQHHVLLWGNAYAAISFDGSGQPTELYPITPNRVRPIRLLDGSKAYVVWTPSGQEVIGDAFMLHVPGLSFDGLSGLSVIQSYRRSIGLSLAAEEYGSRYFANSALPTGVLSVKTGLSDTALKRLKESWHQIHQGSQNSGKIAILEEDAKFQATAFNPSDSQFLETRQFQLNDIARVFRVPPHMIGDLSRSTNNNIEQQALEFVTNTLRRWVVVWEQECKRKLIRTADQQQYFVRFDMDDLLRGDMDSRYKAYATARQWGWYSADDVREKEGENPLPDGQGQTYMVPVNMMTAKDFASGRVVTANKESAVTGDHSPASASPEPPSPATNPDARSLEPVMLDALERIGRREREAFKRAANKPNFASFVQRHITESKDHVVAIVTPVCRAAGLNAIHVADQYIESTKQLAATWGERSSETIDEMLNDWELHPGVACGDLFFEPEKK